MKRLLRVLFFGFTLMELYLIGKRMSQKNNLFSRFIARWCKYKMNAQYGCYLSFKARISPDCKFIHPIGIVVGEGVTIESGCQIYQGVTFGAVNKDRDSSNRYPYVGSGAIIYAGAKVLGGIRIGSHAVIGANSVVIRDVSDRAVVAGVPARSITKNC